jgi:ABC-type nitrate/sulfonate/bicarbonate transport system substrate-binding protein
MIRRLVALLTAAAAIVVAAGPIPATADGTLVPVTFAQPLVFFGGAPWYVAAALGYFKDEGLDVDIVTVGGSPALLAAIQGGSAQFGSTNGLTLLTTVPKGLSLMAFVALDNGQGGFNMVVSRDYAQQHGIRADESYRSVLPKLAGARVAVLNVIGTGGLILASTARQLGMPDDSLKLIGMTVAASVAALEHGQIDAWWQTAPPVGGVLTFRSSDLPHLSEVIGDIGLTSRDEVAKHPDVVAKMARALARGNNALLDQRTQARALDAVYARMPGLPHDEIKAEVLSEGKQVRAVNGAFTAHAFEVTNQVDVQLGLLKTPLTDEQLKSVYTLQFLPKSMVKP